MDERIWVSYGIFSPKERKPQQKMGEREQTSESALGRTEVH